MWRKEIWFVCCLFYMNWWYLCILSLTLYFLELLQAAYNVIAYSHKPRLRTALELLNTTQEIEQQLEKVCDCLFTLYSIAFYILFLFTLNLVQLYLVLLMLHDLENISVSFDFRSFWALIIKWCRYSENTCQSYHFDQ